MPKTYKIEVTGRYIKGIITPRAEMEDMLRYDMGVVKKITTKKASTATHLIEYKAIVVAKYYHPARWASFGIKTKVIK
jgi:hypothetical protein